jgi:hypothetical protein
LEEVEQNLILSEFLNLYQKYYKKALQGAPEESEARGDFWGTMISYL